MRIIKLETKLDSILNGNYFVAGQDLSQVAPRLPYQVLVSCRSSAAPEIKQLILAQLQDGFEQGYTLEITPRAHQALVDFSVSLACSTAERAALVRLVSRLGLEPDIRSVRWQSAPVSQRG
jgi:uncharacterized membrane protein YhiD involved in acid resistance